jgi:Ca2+-binding EF-hand superfamily protein
MKKSLVMFLVATLLLAGCTELLDSEDGETKNIEVNEDIALEKIDDFMTVDESESFGITMMYDMDPAMMGMEEGMLEVGGDSEAVITIEMTEAWSPDGYHTSSSTGMVNGGSSMKFVTSMTHIGTTMYIEMGYETQGDLCADEETQEDIEMCEMMFGDMPAVQSYSMTTTTTHTDVIAAMAEETADDADMDPRFMLEIISYTECMGSFTPAGTVDGLQMFNVSMDMMGEESSLTPQLALCMFDSDDSNTISLDEFLAADESDADDEEADELKTIFDESDLDTNGELNKDELATFIEAIDTNEEEHDHDDHSDHSDDHDDYDEMDGGEDPEMMPDMSVAFNNAGEIEYFSMNMEGTEMKMYVLTEDRVDSLLTNVETGTLVALPFSISDSMYDDDWDDGMDNGDRFYCDNGNDIPADFVNDGDNDCGDNSDENVDMDESDDEFMCNDGSTIPMSFVNDGDEDCDGGEDEDTTDDSDNGGDNSEDQDSEDDGPSPQDLLDMTDTDQNGLMDFDEFITFMSESDETGSGPGESMPQSVIDEFEQMFNVSDLDESGDLDLDELEQFILDLMDYLDDDSGSDDEEVSGCTDMTAINYDAGATDDDGSCYYDDVDDWMMWTFNRDMSECDSDNDGMVNSTEFDDCVIMDLINDGYDSDSYALDNAQMLFDMVDTDEDGMLDSDEFATFAAMTSGEPMMVCYNMDTHEIDMSINSEADCDAAGLMWTESDSGSDDSEEDEFTCDNGETVPLSYVDDGYEDCSDGSDEPNTHDDNDDHDHGDSDGSDEERVWYITNEMDFHFEGNMSTYYIEFASCEEETDYETGETTKDCSPYSQILVADAAAAGGSNGVMYHDADNSGTISEGDMIHVTDEMKMQYDVRLYLMSADAYSDENPMHNAPGFTGLVGMLALLGAAFIRRND